MSITTGFILACITVVLGACGLASFALYLMARDAKEREQEDASRSIIIRVEGYRARRQ